MKGLAVRVQPSDISVETIKAMGARPVAVPFDRVTAALKAGVVDASENSWAGYVSAGHDRVARYYSLTEHSMMPGVLVFSKRVWSELSPDDRRTVRAAAKESVSFMRGKLDSYEVSARLKAEQSGSEVVDTVTRKSFADVLTPLYPKLLPDPALRAMIKQVHKPTPKPPAYLDGQAYLDGKGRRTHSGGMRRRLLLSGSLAAALPWSARRRPHVSLDPVHRNSLSRRLSALARAR
jgi:hypothetical protein